MTGEERLVSNVAPTITRHDDGHLSINWHTSDGRMPALPIVMQPILLVEMIATHNEMREALADVYGQLDSALGMLGHTIDCEDQP